MELRQLETLAAVADRGSFSAAAEALGISQPHSRLIARLGQLDLDPLVGVGQFGLGLVGRGQAFGNFRGALVERGGQRRPDELHGEPDQDQEHNHLNDQGTGDAHFFILRPSA